MITQRRKKYEKASYFIFITKNLPSISKSNLTEFFGELFGLMQNPRASESLQDLLDQNLLDLGCL